MRIRGILLFVSQFTTVGLAIALIAVILRPELLQRPRPVVELRVPAPEQEPAHAQRPGAPAPLSFRHAVRTASPAVVNIYSARIVDSSGGPSPPWELFEPGSPGDRLQTGLGSGVIVSAQGHVLTNHHVVDGANQIHVMLSDGRSADAVLVGSDPETDLAVLKIALPDLPVITLGDSRRVRVGDVVLAIGNPYGVGQAVTLGIVSATGRKRLGLSTYENFIQTDAAINPGNSGGALVNSDGELVGVNTAIFSRSGGSQGVGFAIPVALARDVLTQIIERGRVVRGWLGISMRSLPPALATSAGLAKPFGVVVTGLFEDSPADRANLRPGDILLRMDDRRIYDTRHFMDLIARAAPGTEITLQGLRDGTSFSATTTVGQRPLLQE